MNEEFWNQSYLEEPDQAGVKDFFIAEEAANLPPGSALDLGCGTGEIALGLAANGWRVTGVDFAKEAVRLANIAAQERGLQATFIAADSTTWQAPQQYDLVYSKFAMPAGEAMRRVVAGMVAALKPGGTLMISEWDPRMSAIWGFDEGELHSIEAFLAAMPELETETAETRRVPDPFAGSDMGGAAGQGAYVAFLRLKKPASGTA